MMAFDAIIIGAGHNGLAAAAVLAGRGKKVCVLEQCDVLGGMAQGGELGGRKIGRLAHGVWGLHADILSDLGLKASDLGAVRPTVSLSPDGRHVVLDGDSVAFADGQPHPDAAAFGACITDLRDFGALLATLAKSSPLGAPMGGGLAKGRARLSHLGLGLKLKFLGRTRMREMLRIVLSNVSDYALDHLPDGPLVGVLAADAIKGTWSGPRSPGSVLSLLYRLSAGGGFHRPDQGVAGLCEKQAETLRARGGEIRCAATVAAILIDDDRSVGVRLADGTELLAPLVLSSAGAAATMQMAGTEQFNAEDVRRFRNIRCKGTTAKVNLALSRSIGFEAVPERLNGSRFLIAPSAAYVERAFNAVKYGAISPEPVLETLISHDGGILSVLFHYAPFHLEGGWNKEARERVLNITLETLSHYAPNIADQVMESEVLSPADIAGLTGAPGGHWHHGEWSTDQILTNRPINGMGHYGLGVAGLYLCGAGAHPGGDITGLAGRNAALQALRDGM